MLTLNTQPSSRDIRIFALLWMLFFGLVALVAWFKPGGLVGASMILGGAWLISLIFNSENRLAQLSGVAIPALFGAVGGAVRAGAPIVPIVTGLVAVGVVGALLIFALPGLGRSIYVGWMVAAMPLGWTISHVVLGAVYYVVLTPIGLILRLVGHDPMHRRFDRSASTYWVKRPGMPEASRYFRQF